MTEKLYYSDSHIFAFNAAVLSCEECKGGYAVVLDKTAFFPEGGGQSADTGFIGNACVLDVQERGEEIIHLCDRALTVGTKYPCVLDKEQRLRRMQSHSGEHIVSGLAHRLFGCENVGFHMGSGRMTIDFDRELTWEKLMQIETMANEAVRANLAVRAYFPLEDELEELDYRSKLELTENVRLVEIEGIDLCACCAPHVSYTGEVGLIKILDFMRHRGGVRVSLVCGMDALDEVRINQENVTHISAALSAKRAETAKAVEKLLDEQQAKKERIGRLSMELVRHVASGFEPCDGNICVFDELLDEVALRELANLLADKCGGMAAVFFPAGDARRYIVCSRHMNLRELSREINAAIGGRGGGSAEMIQGSASAGEDEIRAYFK